jgi:hypothetical protein
MVKRMISYSAIHYIYLSACKSKAKPHIRLTNSIRSFHRKFNGQSNFFLTVEDCAATEAALREAYIDYALNLWGEGCPTSPDYNKLLEAVAQNRHIPLSELKNAKLKIQNT